MRYERMKNIIRTLEASETGGEYETDRVVYKSINAAKRASRKLQKGSLRVVEKMVKALRPAIPHPERSGNTYVSWTTIQSTGSDTSGT